jgi:hypothetical protein
LFKGDNTTDWGEKGKPGEKGDGDIERSLNTRRNKNKKV